PLFPYTTLFRSLTNVFRSGLLKHLLKGYWKWQCCQVCAEIPYRFIQDDANATCRIKLMQLIRFNFDKLNRTIGIGFPKLLQCLLPDFLHISSQWSQVLGIFAWHTNTDRRRYRDF